MIKAIALDLDGTLLSNDKKISSINKNILKEFENKGVKIYLITGRTYTSAKPFAKELNLNSYIIAYNGAKIVDYKNDNVIFEMPVMGEQTKKVIEIARKHNIHINLYQNNKWYVETPDDEETKHYASFTGLNPIIKNFDTFDNYDMTKITVQNMQVTDKFFEMIEELKEKLKGEIHTSRSQDFLYEILNKNVNKGIVLKKVLESEGISMEECVAFGDAENDLEMLINVGYGVAMGNSSLELKQKVRYVTDTNDNNGVAKFLKKYFY